MQKGKKQMRKRTNVDAVQPIAVDVKTLAALLGVGRNSALKVGADAGARIQIGSRVVYNMEKINAYLETLAG